LFIFYILGGYYIGNRKSQGYLKARFSVVLLCYYIVKDKMDEEQRRRVINRSILWNDVLYYFGE